MTEHIGLPDSDGDGPATAAWTAEPVDEEARRRMERDWRTGRPQPLESYLPPRPSESFLPTLEELVHIELEYGWKLPENAPQPPEAYVVERYLKQFPELQDAARVAELLEQEYRVRHRHGDRPAAEDVQRRFPQIVSLEDVRGWTVQEPRRNNSSSGIAPGRRVGNFHLEFSLGRGGMGEVWKAHDTVGDRPVVVKFLPAEFQRHPEEVARVQQAFKHIHALQHQHICPTYLLDEDQEFGVYVVMKFIDGVTLDRHRQDCIARRGSIERAEVCRLLHPIAAALDYAHRQQIIHRDIKPQNIMVRLDGRDVQLVDFGLAAEFRASLSRISRKTLDISGTFPYMAPEQWQGQYQDAATDQYALAIVAYEMLTGRRPYEAADPNVLRQCVLRDPLPRPDGASAAIHVVLAQAAAKSRRERFGSCSEFIEALAAADEKPEGLDLTGFTPIEPTSADAAAAAKAFLERTLGQWSAGRLDALSPRYRSEAESYQGYLGSEPFLSRHAPLASLIAQGRAFSEDEILIDTYGPADPTAMESDEPSIVLTNHNMELLAARGGRGYRRTIPLDRIRRYHVSGWWKKRVEVELEDDLIVFAEVIDAPSEDLITQLRA